MTFSDDMAEGFRKSELRQQMRACKVWEEMKSPRGFRVWATGKAYLKVDPEGVVEIDTGKYRWAPDVIDFGKPIKGQISPGQVVFSPDPYKD